MSITIYSPGDPGYALHLPLRQVILPIFIETGDGRLRPAGTGVVIAGFGRSAMMLTAAHTFRTLVRLERRTKSHPSTPDIFRAPEPRKVHLPFAKMRAQYVLDQQLAYSLNVAKVYMGDDLDLAVCNIEFMENAPPEVEFRTRLAIDSSPVAVGQRVIAAGFPTMKIDAPDGQGAEDAGWSLESHLEFRPATVTEVFSHKHPRWPDLGPCFSVDAAFDSGMSGGAVLEPRGDVFVVRGIISCDMSCTTGEDNRGSGAAALASMIWTAMTIEVDGELPDRASGKVRLLEFQRNGNIDDRGDASAHVQILPVEDPRVFKAAWS